MRHAAPTLFALVLAACSSAVIGPRNIPEASRGQYAFDVLLPDASARSRIKGTYTVRADTVLLALEGDDRCRPIQPHLAVEDIRYDCGLTDDFRLIFSFDPRRPHVEAWAEITVTTVGPKRECVAYDRNGRCDRWTTEYGDIPRTQRVRLNAKRVT